METVQTTAATQEIDLSLFGFGPKPVDTGSIGLPKGDDTTSFNTVLNTDDRSTPELAALYPGETGLPATSAYPNANEAPAVTEETEVETETTGRKKLSKDTTISYLRSKIDAEEFAVFSDYDEKTSLDDYLHSMPEKRLYELLDDNINNAKEAVRKEIQDTAAQDILGVLPEQFQAAYEYARNGGQDWDSFYAAMGAANRTAQLDPADENHQVEIAREYLYATNFGDAALIEDQLAEWKTSGRIGDRAQQFKPVLDNMRAQQLDYFNQQQAEQNRQEELAARQFISNVANTVKTGTIAGIKLDSKKQKEIYTALTTANMPSIYGGVTTPLGHKIEQLMYVNPDPQKMAILEWVLGDQEGFFNAIGQLGKNEQVTEDFKKLKTLNQKNTGSSSIIETDKPERKAVKKMPETKFEDWFK
jgi:hypothetical protein